MALAPPAKCTHHSCRHVFFVPGILIGNATGISFAGSKTRCPKCGHIALIGDGTYDFIDEKISLVDGPSSTAEMLRVLTQTFKDSIAIGEAPDKTIERIGAIDPRILQFKRIASAAVFAIGTLLDWASRANTAIDVYEALTGRRAQQEYSQQVQASKEGTELALENFYATKEYQDFKRRLDEQESAPPPPKPASSSPGLKAHPMLIEFPKTAQKLADYEKKRRKPN